MPRVKPGERRRAFRHKSRTGCITCKARRLKCDEEKPACRQCTSTGRTCEGYAQSEPPAAAGSPPESSSGAKTPPPTAALTLLQGDTYLQRRAFAMYREKTSDQAATHQISFWQEVVMPLGYEDTTVRHALVALSMFYEEWQYGTEAAGHESHVAVEQYNMAIGQHLRQVRDSNNMKNPAVLSSSVIFVSIELLRGNFRAAMDIVSTTVPMLWKLLNEESNGRLGDTGEIPIEIADSPLAVIASALRLILVDTDRELGFPVPLPPSPSSLGVISMAMPATFNTILEARHYMDMIANAWCNENMREVPTRKNDNLYYPQPSSQFVLNRWREAYDNLLFALPKSRPLTEDGRQDILTLEIRWVYLFIAQISDRLREEGIVDDLAWSKYYDIERTISYMESDMPGEKAPAGSSSLGGAGGVIRYGTTGEDRRSPIFMLELGVMTPFFQVMRKRRHSSFQECVINVLARHTRGVELLDDRLRMRVFERYAAEQDGQGPASVGDGTLSIRIAYSWPEGTWDQTEFFVMYTRSRKGLGLQFEISDSFDSLLA